MGHHIGSKSSLVPLIDRLNMYPVGLVDNEKLRKILEILFDEDEAFVASRFPLQEALLSELSKCTKIPDETLLPILERMADKGLVMDLNHAGETYYLLMPGLIGFFEFTFMKRRDDLPMADVARLMSEYLYEDTEQGQAREFFGSQTSLTRALVYENQIPVSSEVTAYEDAKRIIETSSFGATGLCYCRHKKIHLDQSCGKEAPIEDICISLGSAAKFMVRRGFAKEKNKAELLEVLDRARAFNLTHITDNIRSKPSFICNCCSCCCELMLGVQAGYHDGIGKSPYLANVDRGLCNGCGLCVPACNTKAIDVCSDDSSANIISTACLGCGVCVSVCKREALQLIERKERLLPPANRKEMFVSILKEKRRLKPFVVSGLKKRFRQFFPGG